MSIFISSQDYITMAGDCLSGEIVLCGHKYTFWYDKNKESEMQEIVSKINEMVEKYNKKFQGQSFDKIILMASIELLFKIQQKEKEKADKQQLNSNINSSKDDDREKIISNTIDILSIIKQNL